MTGPTSIEEVRARVAVGAPLGAPDLLPARVGRAVRLAADLGAPVGPTLDAAAQAHADERAGERERATATAQARAVTRALGALPLVAVPALGAMLDLPLVAFYGTSTGRSVLVACVALGSVGLFLASVITRRTMRAGPRAGVDEVCDLVALCLSSGLGPGAAVRVVAAVCPTHAPTLRRLGLALDHAVPGRVAAAGLLAPLEDVLRTASRLGAPAAPALHRLATDLRAAERARVTAAAQRLPAHLTFPTVLFLLPSSLLLVGAPLLAAGLATAQGT